MSTPDLQIVREIARDHIRSGHADIGTTIVKHFGNGSLGDEEYADWYHAVVQVWRVELRAVSWPDEQRPANPMTEDDATAGTCTMDCVMGHTNEPGCLYDTTSKLAEQRAADVATAEQQQDGAAETPCVCGDPNCMPYWRPVYQQMNEMRLRSDRAAADFTKAMLEEICEERTRAEQAEAERAALAERVAELKGEREADTRAVRGLLMALIVLGSRWPAGLERRANRLRARFADRIAALDADTDGGAEPPTCSVCHHWAASHYTGTDAKTGCSFCRCRRSAAEAQRES